MFGYGYYYGFDYTYFVFILPALIIALIAQIAVKSAYSKYSKVRNSRGLTGAAAAEAVLRANGVTGVTIEHVSGNLTDHFDPRSNVIRLSDGVFNSNSVAAVGIAAHEAGHAVQYASDYTPIKLRNFIIPVTQFGSTMALPLFLIGFLFNFGFLMYLGIAFYSLALLFQLVTLPVEFNASRRAMNAINTMYFNDDEVKGARKVLTAAAMTYVAAMLTSLAQLLRLLVLAGGRRRR